MTVRDFAVLLKLNVLCGSEEALNNPVTGGYCGDLLSWVMGRARADSAWITIMSNPNVAAVAHLSGVSCVVLAEGVSPDEGLLGRCRDEDIPLLSSQLSAFEISGPLYSALEK